MKNSILILKNSIIILKNHNFKNCYLNEKIMIQKISMNSNRGVKISNMKFIFN